MNMADQENLLPQSDSRNTIDGGSPSSISFKFHNNYYTPYRSQMKKNLLLLIVSLLFATCLTVYIYLNYIAINGSSVGSNIDIQADQNDRYKPLSRRKPILDHESIFSESGPSMLKLSDLMAHCIVALRVGGEKVVQLSLKNNDKLADVASKGKTKEGANDVVTGADMRSHEAILNTIKDSYRRLRVVSEEDTTSAFENLKMEEDILPIDRGEFARLLRENLHQIEGEQSQNSNWPLISQHETLVWIDPLDATKEYSENLTEYVTLMACIVHKSIPIAGIIYKPFLNKTYWSLTDNSRQQRNTVHSKDLLKVWSNERQRGTTDQGVKITVSRSHAGDVEHVIRETYSKSVKIIPAGGSGYKTIELIKANVNAYVHVTHIKKWDICAPHAILNSLPQGKMTDLKGGEIDFGDPKDKLVTNGLIATLDQKLHIELMNSLKNYAQQ